MSTAVPAINAPKIFNEDMAVKELMENLCTLAKEAPEEEKKSAINFVNGLVDTLNAHPIHLRFPYLCACCGLPIEPGTEVYLKDKTA